MVTNKACLAPNSSRIFVQITIVQITTSSNDTSYYIILKCILSSQISAMNLPCDLCQNCNVMTSTLQVVVLTA